MASEGQPHGGSSDKPPSRSGGSGAPRSSGSGRPAGGKPAGGKPYGDKPAGGKPYGSKPAGGRSGDGKSYGDKPAGGKSYGDKPAGGKSYGSKPAGGRSSDGKPYGDKPSGSRSYGDKPYGDKPSGGRPPSGQGGDRSRSVRTSSGDRKQYGERGERNERPERKVILDVPEIPEEIEYGQLDKQVRSRLRTLSKENAEDVGRHLIMAGLLVETDPELAYRHAMVASARGGRVDVVREAAALTAYATGRYAEALRELRTVRRLSGSSEHLALMADCERGLGRPERAIALSQEPEAASLDPVGKVEMAIVVAGARADMGDLESALGVLNRLVTKEDALQVRIDEARADVLRKLGRADEAEALESSLPSPEPEDDDEDIVVYDTVIPEDQAETGGPSEPDAGHTNGADRS